MVLTEESTLVKEISDLDMLIINLSAGVKSCEGMKEYKQHKLQKLREENKK